MTSLVWLLRHAERVDETDQVASTRLLLLLV